MAHRPFHNHSQGQVIEKARFESAISAGGYRRLESAANKATPTADNRTALESAIADIQLLGSSEQVHIARQLALDFAGTGQVSLDPLLEALRKELRNELSLEPLREGLTFLRIFHE